MCEVHPLLEICLDRVFPFHTAKNLGQGSVRMGGCPSLLPTKLCAKNICIVVCLWVLCRYNMLFDWKNVFTFILLDLFFSKLPSYAKYNNTGEFRGEYN